MSYDIAIFHSSVKQKIDHGFKIDCFEHSRFEEKDLARFLERLVKYGYKPENEHASIKAFIKEVNACPIQVHIFSTQISFSVPYWSNSESAIFEALQDANELSDSEDMVLYDQQTGEWTL